MTNELAKIKYVYLLGIGGIGMSALARYFHATGKEVVGYDNRASVSNGGVRFLFSVPSFCAEKRYKRDDEGAKWNVAGERTEQQIGRAHV